MAGPSYKNISIRLVIIWRIYLLLSVLYKAGKQNPGAKGRHISWRFFKTRTCAVLLRPAIWRR